MPSRAPLAPFPVYILFLLHALCCMYGVVAADPALDRYIQCDPDVTPCAKPEEGTAACSACAVAPHSAACQTAYHQQPALYCGNSTMQLAHVRVSTAACCPLVLDSTPVQCVPVEYHAPLDELIRIESFMCRGKVLPPAPHSDKELLKTVLALLGVVAPICLILTVYAVCRLYRRCRPLSLLPRSDTLLDDTNVEKDVSFVDVRQTDRYEMPVFRPPAFHVEGEMIAFRLSNPSDDDSGVH